MGKSGREPLCAEVRPINMVEEIASAYLIQAGGNPSVALRRAINDALTDSFEAEQRIRLRRREYRAFADQKITVLGDRLLRRRWQITLLNISAVTTFVGLSLLPSA